MDKKLFFWYFDTRSNNTVYIRKVGRLKIWKAFGRKHHFPTDLLYIISLKVLRNQGKL